MDRRRKFVAHVLLFIAPGIAFHADLGISLAGGRVWGAVLWVAAVVLAALNVVWIVRSRMQSGAKETSL